VAVRGAGTDPELLHPGVDLVVDRLGLAGVAAGGDDEEVGEGGDRPQIEDEDVARQLLLRESGDLAGLVD
jgi:hypothetical protein